MSGNREGDGPSWPERDLQGESSGNQPPSPTTEASEPTISLGDGAADTAADTEGWDPGRDGDRRRPTTAEQAVPWLIGVLLALTGIVVVLIALIFIGPNGVAGVPTPSPTPSASEQATASATPIESQTPVPTQAPTASPPVVFGALEMTFLGRAAAASPIRLQRRDFTTTTDPAVVLEDPAGVAHYAWAPDGRVGVGIIASRAVALVEGQQPRALTDPLDAVVFGDDSTTLYGVRITRDGANDRVEVLKIDFNTGTTKVVATVSYPHPTITYGAALKEAQFADNGGLVRMWMTVDGQIAAWIIGAPATYHVNPATGAVVEGDHQPALWSPDQRTRIDVAEKAGSSTLALLDKDGVPKASVKVSGLVSHIRWAGSSNEIVFTLGRIVGGAVSQDLYVWDLVDGKAPAALTSNGASFGAEWLGVAQAWVP